MLKTPPLNFPKIRIYAQRAAFFFPFIPIYRTNLLLIERFRNKTTPSSNPRFLRRSRGESAKPLGECWIVDSVRNEGTYIGQGCWTRWVLPRRHPRGGWRAVQVRGWNRYYCALVQRARTVSQPWSWRATRGLLSFLGGKGKNIFTARVRARRKGRGEKLSENRKNGDDVHYRPVNSHSLTTHFLDRRRHFLFFFSSRWRRMERSRRTKFPLPFEIRGKGSFSFTLFI